MVCIGIWEVLILSFEMVLKVVKYHFLMGKLRVGVVGVGARGSDHVTWYNKRQDTELVAICDISKERGKPLADTNKVAYYHDYNELFEKEKLDIVSIATPHYLHAPVTVAASEHDVNVFCEKPMALNLSQCDEMIRACRKNAVKLAVGLQMRYIPEFQYLYDAIRGAKGENGSLGRITDVYMTARHHRNELYYMTSSLVDPKIGPYVPPGPWRGRWLTEGGGVIINQAIHNIDILRWIVGPIRSLSAHGSILGEDHALIEVDDTVAVSFEAESGLIGTFIVSSSNRKPENNRIVIHGSDSYIIAGGGYTADKITYDGRYTKEEDYEIPIITEPHLQNQTDNFIHSIKNDVSPKVTGEEGRKSVEVLRAILKSIQNESCVHFPLQDSNTFPTLTNRNYD
jgi:predicted dehydrogenase